MSKGLIFFGCACCILALTIVNLSIGPIITRKIENYGTENCAYLKDYYDRQKERKPNMDDLEKKYTHEWGIKQCDRRKAMSNMEYTSFIFDIVIGFVCSLIGLLHLFEVKKDIVSTTGLIGLGCGAVGFVLTFIYVIYNGIVYTNYYDYPIYKMDGDGAFAELKGDKYECFYFDEKGNNYALYAKFSDLGKKQYNYDKDFLNSVESDEFQGCKQPEDSCMSYEDGKIQGPILSTIDGHECKYLYASNNYDNGQQYGIDAITNKDVSDRFLTTLILSLFICLANIGLALFGFLLFRTPGDF